MSLKTFHIIFVLASVSVAAFVSVWAFLAYRDSGAIKDLAFSVSGGMAVVTLLVYGRYFLKKLKHISYL